jgi:hypothetical protein
MSDKLLFENAEQLIETGIAMLYKGLLLYREAGEYRTEYEAMSALSVMLQEDRKYLMNRYKEKINAPIHIS